MKVFHVLGFDDGVHTCDCCGKTDLKGTYGIEMIETGEVLHYGSVCVTRNTARPMKELNAMQKAYEAERVVAARAEYHADPAYAASVARFKEAHALKIAPGRAFKEFVKEAYDAENAVRRAVAAKYGLHPLKLA